MCSTLLKHSLEARIKLTFNVCLKILINPAFYETCTRILSLKTNVLLLDENGGDEDRTHTLWFDNQCFTN